VAARDVVVVAVARGERAVVGAEDGAGLVVAGATVLAGAARPAAVGVVPAKLPQPAGNAAVSATASTLSTRSRPTRPACHPVVGRAAYARCMSNPFGQSDLSALLQQAQQMQQQLVTAQEELAQTEVTGSAGGGLVSATMTGSGELTALTIAPSAVDPDDLETLQDLVVAAVRDAKRAADELAASRMGPLAGGLGGGLGLPGL
jgi:DNA-binding YbaB/EbfC family protein